MAVYAGGGGGVWQRRPVLFGWVRVLIRLHVATIKSKGIIIIIMTHSSTALSPYLGWLGHSQCTKQEQNQQEWKKETTLNPPRLMIFTFLTAI